ncbi:MAG: hypothetical protein HYX41_05725, partial [Bdellovibrio sp.]|nr:hypothetical protein [Bdellovibrio sp.]
MIEKISLKAKSRWDSRFFTGCFILIVMSTLAGCSLNKSKDDDVLKTHRYRRINSECQVNSAQLDAKSLRGLVSCLNAYGGLEPIHQLFAKLSDSDLQLLTDHLNTTVLKDPDTLFRIQESVKSLTKHNYLDKTFAHLAELLRKDLIISSLAVLHDSYNTTSSTTLRNAGKVKPEEDLLKAFELIGTQFDAAFVAEALGFGLNLASAPAFHAFQKQVGKVVQGKTFSLATIVKGMHTFYQDTHTYACDAAHPDRALSDDVIGTILNGDAFTLADDLLGKNAKEIQDKLDGMVFVLNNTTSPAKAGAGKPVLLEPMLDAVKKFNRPISCLEGTQEVPNAARHLLSRLAELPDSKDATDYILSGAVKELFLLKPVCDLP